MLHSITCRVCASTDNALHLLGVFEKQNASACVADLLQELAEIKVSVDDGFPQQCCKQCQTDLIQAVTLKRKCIETDKLIRASGISSCFIKDEYYDDQSDNVSIPSPHYEHAATADDDVHYRCRECLVDLADSKALKQHYEAKHANVIYSWECFGISEISLFDSTDDEQEEVLNKEVPLPVVLDPAQPNHLPKHYRCCGCMLVFDTEANLKQHSETTHASNALKVEGVNVFQCNVCYRLFANEGSLKDHRNTDYSLRFQCPTCGLLFSTQGYLKRHEFKHMEGKFTCETCDKIFSYPGSLRTHNRRFHAKSSSSEEKQHICNVCGKCLKSAAYLKCHIKLHSKEEPFCCSLCGARFKLPRYLKWHMAKHKELYKCKECELTFTNASNLQQHMNSHSDTRAFPCFLCGKAFHNRKNLNKHLRVIHSFHKRKAKYAF